MARARSTGPAVYIGALVFLGAGFVIFLVLFILFFARVEAAENSAREAQAALDKFASSAERSSAEVRDVEAIGQGTVVGKLLEENATLKLVASGSRTRLLSEIEGTLSGMGIDGNMLGEIKSLQENLAAQQNETQRAQGDADKTRTLYTQAQEAKAQLGTQYGQAVERLKGELDKLSGDFGAFRDKVAAQAADLRNLLQQVRDDSQQKLVDLESQLAQKDETIAKRTSRIDTLMADLTGRGRIPDVDASLLPDGKVATVLSKQGLVYINRGMSDHIMPGMTFEVYDSTTGPTKTNRDGYRGKATIEVVNVLDDHTSVARIVRRPERGQAVIEGDDIANLVFDPDMVLKFFVFGGFDIDGTGQATETDRRRVEMMILDWGGELASARQAGGKPKPISYDVDFLILGQEPELPEAPSEDEIDPGKEKAYIQAKRRYETYHTLVLEAKDLSIPVLNQNRFLTMTGYYQR